MINFNIVDVLKEAEVPVYHEHTICDGVELPALSYKPLTNMPHSSSKEFSYDRVGYNVSVWATSSRALNELAATVDIIMNKHNFTRTGFEEVWLDQKTGRLSLTYVGLAYNIWRQTNND